ncbi:hypothetical protein BC831DRAFT_439964 [Entophlyctis helioformis]|nr:hypothetical protein BC831DRAFT_439964 [Entophlyctis helioformis]
MSQSHPLLERLQQDFPAIYSSVETHDWIVLLPPAHLFLQHVGVVSEDFISSHIVRTFLSDSVHVTLNNKQIVIDGTTILTDLGFDTEASCEILDDALQVNATGRSFTVYFIDKPLLRLDGASDRSAVSDASSLVSLLGQVTGGAHVIERIMQRVTIFNDLAISMDSLAAIEEDIQKLLNDCSTLLGSLDEKQLLPLLRQRNLSWDALYQLIETFVMEHTYEIVFFRVTSFHRQQDARLVDILSSEFVSVAVARTPIEKIKCLRRCIEILSGTQAHTDVSRASRLHETEEHEASSPTLLLTTDTLVSLLILIIIRSNTFNITSNAYYMKHFSFEHDVESGEYGYILSTLEAVLHYIDTSHELLANLSSLALTFLDAARDGDVSRIQRSIQSKTQCRHLRIRQSEHIASASAAAQSTPLASGQLGSLASLSPAQTVTRCRTWQGETGLILAVRHRRGELVQFFLDQGEDPSVADYTMTTPLHICAKDDLADLADMLLRSNADQRRARNCFGETPLLLAVAAGHDRLVESLAQDSEVLDIQTCSGNTVLHVAVTAGLVARLLRLGANPNIRNNDGLTPVLHHCHAGQTECARELIVNGLQPNGVVDLKCYDLGHRTILHLCAFRGSCLLVQIMLDSIDTNSASPKSVSSGRKFCIDAVSLRGNSALHSASDAGEFEIVESLLRAGADPQLRNFQDRSPADVAHNEDIRNLIEDYALCAGSRAPKDAKVAKVVRTQITGSDLCFIVKSGTQDQHGSISTVVRRLQDFGVLRSQLLIEHPEAGIPDMRELFSNPPWIVDNVKTSGSMQSRLLRKIVRRLDKFIDFLLRHPIFANHELTWEFLVLPEIEPDMVRARSRSKLEYIKETIRESYHPFVENLAENTSRVEDEDARLLMLHAAVRQTGLSCRNVGKARKVSLAQHHLSRPSSTLFESKSQFSEVFRKSASSLMKQALSESQDAGDFFLECVYEISGLRQGLIYYQQVVEEYIQFAEQANSLNDSLEKLHSQAARTSTEDSVRRLNDAYYEYSKIAAVVEEKACALNHTTKCVFEEMGNFTSYHTQLVQDRLDAHVRRQIGYESSLLTSLMESLGLDGTE